MAEQRGFGCGLWVGLAVGAAVSIVVGGAVLVVVGAGGAAFFLQRAPMPPPAIEVAGTLAPDDGVAEADAVVAEPDAGDAIAPEDAPVEDAPEGAAEPQADAADATGAAPSPAPAPAPAPTSSPGPSPAPKPPPAPAPAPEPQGTVAPDVLATVLNNNVGVKKCFIPLFKAGQMPSRVDVKLTVQPSGSVTAASVTGPANLAGGDFDACMGGAMKAVSFPPFPGKAQTLPYAFQFSG